MDRQFIVYIDVYNGLSNDLIRALYKPFNTPKSIFVQTIIMQEFV